MANLFSGLSDLPVFEGRSEEDRRSALLATGLGLLQPQDPLAGGNALTQLGGGVQAGLTSLDTTAATNRETEQQAFQNIITGRAAATDETRAESGQVVAEAAALNAETNVAAQGQDVTEFSAEKGLREAKIDLNKAQAEWLRRRFAGDPSASTKVTAAMLEDKVIQAQMENLLRSDPEKYTLSDGKPNIALLTVQAFNDLHKAKGLAASEQLGLIVNTGEAEEISGNISTLQGPPPEPATEPQVQVITTLDEFNALPIGAEYSHNGQKFRKDK